MLSRAPDILLDSLGSLEVVWPPAEWTSVVLWSLLQLEAGCGHADKIVSAVRDD